MQNAVLYTRHAEPDTFANALRAAFPDARHAHQRRGETEHTFTVTRKGGWFSRSRTLTCNFARRATPGVDLDGPPDPLLDNLRGMAGFVRSLPYDPAGALVTTFVAKIGTVNAQVACIAEPDYDDAFAAGLRAVARELDAFVFASPDLPFARDDAQHFLDADFRLVVGGSGASDVEEVDVVASAAHYDPPAESATAEQRRRKSESERLLADRGVTVNARLPCVVGAEALALRPASEVLDRAYALLVVAARGEDVPREKLDGIRAARGITALSPAEQAAYDDPALDAQHAGALVWRYEGLNVLLWSLGLAEALPYPSEMCDVAAMLNLLLPTPREEVAARARLRPGPAILDALDLHYRCHWACVDARVNGAEAPGGLHPGVVYERHRALNWLTRYRDQAWDDVTTDT